VFGVDRADKLAKIIEEFLMAEGDDPVLVMRAAQTHLGLLSKQMDSAEVPWSRRANNPLKSL
jgi:hypothetical protein